MTMNTGAVTTLEELDSFDEKLMVLGYMHGFRETPDYTKTEKAYWHGYLNGQVDGGHMPSSIEQQRLAALYLNRMRAN